MNLSDYLTEIEFAATQVLDSLWREYQEAETLREEFEALQRKAGADYGSAASILQNAEDPDDVMLGVGIYWETYFGPDKQRHSKSSELAALKSRLATREFSFAALAGVLLQFAKQGLSVAYGAPRNWPTGRPIGSLTLKTVILEARNQSQHWEEGKLRESAECCFETLKEEKNPVFAQYRTKSLAFEVISMLGWRTFAEFRADMNTLRQPA